MRWTRGTRRLNYSADHHAMPWPHVQCAVTSAYLAVLCPVAVAAASASMVALTAAVTASRILQATVPGATCDVYDFNDSGWRRRR